jgi:FAD synthase
VRAKFQKWFEPRFAANLDPELLTQELDGLMNGVYFGWARLVAAGKDDRVYKMVMNVGNRPTFADGAGQTVVSLLLLSAAPSAFYFLQYGLHH